MEWPKRARTVNWESGVLTLDGEKQFEIPELTAEIMEQLAAYTLVGFHVKGYPVTDKLLAPFAGHKSMANFGVEAYIKHIENYSKKLQDCLNDCENPVSYTHLDVYKRQLLWFPILKTSSVAL